MAYTRGPWERRWSRGDPEGDTCMIVGPTGVICHLVMDDAVEDTARLIYVAPELLAGIKHFGKHGQSPIDGANCAVNIGRACTCGLDALLAKAVKP